MPHPHNTLAGGRHFSSFLRLLRHELYPNARHLEPTPHLSSAITIAAECVNKITIKLPANYQPTADPSLPNPDQWIHAALHDILQQIEQQAVNSTEGGLPIGKLGMIVRTKFPRHLERWGMQLVWFVLRFFERGCGVPVCVAVDHAKEVLQVQVKWERAPDDGVCGGFGRAE